MMINRGIQIESW